MSAIACIFRSESISPPRPSEISPVLFFEHQKSKCLGHRLLVASKLAFKLLDVLF